MSLSYRVRLLVSLGQYCSLRLVAAFQGSRLRLFLAPATCEFLSCRCQGLKYEVCGSKGCVLPLSHDSSPNGISCEIVVDHILGNSQKRHRLP